MTGSTLRQRFQPANFIFLVTVAIPTLLAVIYFGFLSSDVYISESRFVVRSPTKAAVTSLGQVLSGSALNGSSEESNAVVNYLESRGAFDQSDSDGLLSRSYRAATIFWLDRFGSLTGESRERFYEYYRKKVLVDQEATTQVLQLTVRAFTPADARAINERLLERSETLVNRLSDRARADLVAVARGEVDQAKAQARSAALALAEYRDRAGIIDPEKEAAIRLQMVSKLQDELITTRTQLRQMQEYTPKASQIPYLRTQLAELQREIDEQTAGIAGSSRSLSAAAARYQVLMLDSMLADKQLAASLASLQEAQAEARRKRAYVERIAEPSLPDYPLEPRRLRAILATLVLGLIAWGVLSTLIQGVREHRE